MSKGVLIFAHNNLEIDYIKLSVFAASRVKEYLGLPVTLVTDSRAWLLKSFPEHEFDSIIDIQPEKAANKLFYDGSLSSKSLEWKNLSRNMAYRLSPYDTTLVIDSDYIVSSSLLKSAFENDTLFQIYHDSVDLAGWRPNGYFRRINPYSIPFYWATAFVFRKDVIVESFFDLIAYIKLNWSYFRVLYNIETTIFRNDYAFSIAIHIMNGKTSGEFATPLPGKMTYIQDTDLLIGIDKNKMQFLVEKEKHLGEYLVAKTEGLDIHVMNKYSLLRFIDGETGV